MITHGVHGFLHAPGDLAGMAESTIRLLLDDVMRGEMSTAAHQMVRERYCLSLVAPKYEDYYVEVLSRA